MLSFLLSLVLAITGTVTDIEKQADKYPIYGTTYDWRLGGVNCDHDCSRTAMGVKTDDSLIDRTAGCPESWLGGYSEVPISERKDYTSVVILEDGSEWWCIDVLGDEENRKLVEVFGKLAYRVDFATTQVHDFYRFFDEYSVSWKSFEEFGG